MPDSATAYVIMPGLITYEFTDSTAGNQFRLRWLPEGAFQGYNCVGFIADPPPADTVGRFYFAYSGSNQGSVERLTEGVTDTVPGNFLYQGIGSHGTFLLDGDRLHLNWADGDTPSRYFDPSAELRFAADTLWSSVELSANGDTVHVVWRVAWQQGFCP
jgi:hypothetical protein